MDTSGSETANDAGSATHRVGIAPPAFLRALKAVGRHWYRSAQLAVGRPTPRYAHKQPMRVDSPTLWIDVRTPIMQRPGPDGINENRLHNMELASRHLSGIVIHGGETFRWWRHIPRAIPRNGFRAGFSLIDGALKLDYGGGLCQVATTLYQAFLGSDFDIIERSNHSVDVHGAERFFELGRDAAVAFGYRDLIVRNPTAASVSVRAAVDRETMTYRVVLESDRPGPPLVRIRSEPSPPLGSDRGGDDVERITTIRESRRNGAWVETYLAHDVYRAP